MDIILFACFDQKTQRKVEAYIILEVKRKYKNILHQSLNQSYIIN